VLQVARTGRPKIQIDKRQFETMCAILCTEVEICNVLDISEDTLNRWCKSEYSMTFAETYKKLSANGKASLRRMQFKLAEKSAAMAIFLGKNYLGQTDKDETDTITEPVKIVIQHRDSDNEPT
jgi:hypothetical protein